MSIFPELPKIVTLPSTATEEEVEHSKRYVIVFYNDDTTPIEFVLLLLAEVFKYDLQKSTEITMRIHKGYEDVVWTGSLEIGELRMEQIGTLCTEYLIDFKYELKEM